MLFGHDEPDDGASGGKPTPDRRMRDQRTTVPKTNLNAIAQREKIPGDWTGGGERGVDR